MNYYHPFSNYSTVLKLDNYQFISEDQGSEYHQLLSCQLDVDAKKMCIL